MAFTDPVPPGRPARPAPLADRRFRLAWVIVALAALPLALLFGFAVLHQPSLLIALPFVAVPAAILAAALLWVDRLEPEPDDARLLALAWGGVVAVLVSGVVNTAAQFFFGEFFALVVSAPVVEELAKVAVLGFIWRRRLIASPLDGVVYVFCSAAGFAVVEDLLYFAAAVELEGASGLLGVVLLRGIFTPFAHPLFSLPVGLALGWVASRRPGRGWASAALAAATLAAVLVHAAWNAALGVALVEGAYAVAGVAALGFVALFAAAVVLVVVLRARQSRWFTSALPALIFHLGLDPHEHAVFSSTAGYLRCVKSLPRHSRPVLRELRWTLHALAAALAAPVDRSVPGEMDRLTARAHELRSRLPRPLL